MTGPLYPPHGNSPCRTPLLSQDVVSGEEFDRCEATLKRALVALDLVSGALMDSGAVVPFDQMDYGNAVRRLTAERYDRALEAATRIGQLKGALLSISAPLPRPERPDMGRDELLDEYGAEIDRVRAIARAALDGGEK